MEYIAICVSQGSKSETLLPREWHCTSSPYILEIVMVVKI